MSITADKMYRTRDGRAVRIYATDGGEHQIHGATENSPGWWGIRNWDDDGKHPLLPECDLIEATLADELNKQIPWDALCADIHWVAMQPNGQWLGFNSEPARHGWIDVWDGASRRAYKLTPVNMPRVDLTRWDETRCKRPEAT